MRRIIAYFVLGAVFGLIAFISGAFNYNLTHWLIDNRLVAQLCALIFSSAIGFAMSRALRWLDALLFAGALSSRLDEIVVRLALVAAWAVIPAVTIVFNPYISDLLDIVYLLAFAAGLWERTVYRAWRRWRGLETPEQAAAAPSAKSYHVQALIVVVLAIVFGYFAYSVEQIRDDLDYVTNASYRQSDRVRNIEIAQSLIIRELESARPPGDTRPRLLADLPKGLDLEVKLYAAPSILSGNKKWEITSQRKEIKAGEIFTLQTYLNLGKGVGKLLHLVVFRWTDPHGAVIALEAREVRATASRGGPAFLYYALPVRSATAGRYELQVIADGTLIAKRSVDIVP